MSEDNKVETETPDVEDLRGQYNIPEQLRNEIKHEILEMVLIGYLVEEIRPIIQDKYDISYQTSRRYCNDVYDRIRKAKAKVADDHELNVSLAIGRLQLLYRKAIEQGKLNVAGDTLKQLHALQGLVSDGKAGVNINIANGVGGAGQQSLQNVPTEVLMAQYENKALPEPVRPIPKRLTATQVYDMDVEE